MDINYTTTKQGMIINYKTRNDYKIPYQFIKVPVQLVTYHCQAQAHQKPTGLGLTRVLTNSPVIYIHYIF